MWTGYSKWDFGNGMWVWTRVISIRIQVETDQICPLLVGKAPRDLKLNARLHIKLTLTMSGTVPQLTNIRQSSENYFKSKCTIKCKDSYYTTLFVSTLTCRVHSSKPMGPKQHCEVNFILSLAYTTACL
jgi:hypothetical protein